MSECFLGEIRIMSFNFAPKNWAMCNGALIPIAQNTALFSLLGTNYGGNGTTVFGLPDLRSRVPFHQGTNVGNSYVVGQFSGNPAHTLNTSEMPQHVHTMQASTAAATPGTGPAGGVPTVAAHAPYRSGGVQSVAMKLAPAGGNQPHDNRQPSLGLNFCIALFGLFPSQN